MGKPNFSDAFKRDAVAQITERGYPVAKVSQRLGVSQHSLYSWKRQLGRKPRRPVLIHSDQGGQFTSMDWAAFIRAHNLEHSMGRRGNCHDNAVTERLGAATIKGCVPLQPRRPKTKRMILLVSLFLALPVYAEPSSNDLETFLRAKMHRERIPALQVSVIRHGKIVKTAAYGTANVENGVSASKESIFSINAAEHLRKLHGGR